MLVLPHVLPVWPSSTFSGCYTTVRVFFPITDIFPAGPSWTKLLVSLVSWFWIGFVLLVVVWLLVFLLLHPYSWKEMEYYKLQNCSSYQSMMWCVWTFLCACDRWEKGNLEGPGGDLARGCPWGPRENLPGLTEALTPDLNTWSIAHPCGIWINWAWSPFEWIPLPACLSRSVISVPICIMVLQKTRSISHLSYVWGWCWDVEGTESVPERYKESERESQRFWPCWAKKYGRDIGNQPSNGPSALQNVGALLNRTHFF